MNVSSPKNSANLPPELFYTALNSTIDAVVIALPHGEIIWVNDAFERLTEYSYQEAIGQDTSLLKSGRMSDQFYSNMWNTLTSGKVWQGEMWNKRKSGQVYYEDQTITPIKDSDNKITHYVAIKRDVSEKVAIKKQLEHAEKMDAIGLIAGGISHNFNNKLVKILGYAELAEECSASHSNEKLESYLSKIQLAGDEAKKLVEQLQTFCREESGQFQKTSLFDVLDNFVPLLRSSVPRNVDLIIPNRNIDVQVEVDAVKVNQMLFILINNAIKSFIDSGKITVSVGRDSHVEDTCASCHQSIEGDYVTLTVEDNGSGIEANHLKRLFLPFFTTHQMDGGTGMGLSVLHGIMHEHNGHVVVQSTPNVGTAFTLYFPTSDCVKAELKEGTEIRVEKRDRTHIILVDDEPLVVNLYKDLLGFLDIDVTSFTSVQLALEKFSSAPGAFDLLITDQNMPGITGLMLIKAVKNMRPDIPAILISGKTIANYQHEDGFEELVDGFLPKPFHTEQLSTLVNELLDKKKLG